MFNLSFIIMFPLTINLFLNVQYIICQILLRGEGAKLGKEGKKKVHASRENFPLASLAIIFFLF